MKPPCQTTHLTSFLIAIIALSCASCSWAFMTSPPENNRYSYASDPSSPVRYTTSVLAPVIDTTVAVLTIVGEISRQPSEKGVVSLGIPIALLWGWSATNGYLWSSECSELKAHRSGLSRKANVQLKESWTEQEPSHATINAVMRGYTNAIESCSGGGGSGAIEVTFTIEPNGTVSAVSATAENVGFSDESETREGDCVIALVRTILFPPFSGPPQEAEFLFRLAQVPIGQPPSTKHQLAAVKATPLEPGGI